MWGLKLFGNHRRLDEGELYDLIPEGEHKKLQKKLADIVKAGIVVNGFRIIGDLETISKGVSKFDLVPEGEYAKLKLEIKKLQNTLINVNLANSSEWYNLRKRVEKLTTALNECYSTIAALEKGNEELKEENEVLKAEMAGEERQKMLVEENRVLKVKCSICNNTGKPCASCGEYHSSRCMCPPHEVRMKWIENICPDCGTKEPENTDKINFYNNKPESEFEAYKVKYPHVPEKQLRREWEDNSGDLRQARLSAETGQWP